MSNLRGFAKSNAEKTHCTKGHEYDELNTYIDSVGKRRCKACRSEQGKKKRKENSER